MGINKPVRKRHLGGCTWRRWDRKEGIGEVRSLLDHRRTSPGLK
jgi:hypothetical protein